jgi:predicted metal-binding protein
MSNVVKFEKKQTLIPTLKCGACSGMSFELQRDPKEEYTFLSCLNCQSWIPLDEALEAIGHES